MLKINEFQQLMKDIYLKRDQKQGLNKTFIHLIEEIGELAECLNSKNKEIIQNEIADIVAWIFSIANLLEIDMEASLLNKYPMKCPRCKNNPCICK
ncbi:MAG: nucleotide pyrophosphohydrolase [Candidatus Heimdallarchaeum endolithica]|uniref:Nucleotide pyrophosphohydrolase n=1 Tax=Candidatus Heimdallarchaeum endolithica TaxID=2876572 RepID=A0A9Y1BPW9_9ARCH|nr:MAG: nucleotide pyrophosphohydrolase [Candidatus Heimdallarchaeum endolithica]